MALAKTDICDFGWKARDFALKGVDGKTYSLADVLAGTAARRHVDLQHIGHAVSCLPRFRRWLEWRLAVAGGCPSHHPDRAFDL